jgi:NADP-dependent 3-hydroxy acid dehydrogenase YdfG
MLERTRRSKKLASTQKFANTKDEKALIQQVAVVTGAGRGIGAAIAIKLADMGAAAVLCGRTKEHLESTAKTIFETGGKAHVRWKRSIEKSNRNSVGWTS